MYTYLMPIYIIYRTRKALRKRVNELRREADRFQRQVDYLVLEEQDLVVEVERLVEKKQPIHFTNE